MSSKTAGKQNPAPAAMQPMLLDTTQAGVFGGTEVPATSINASAVICGGRFSGTT